MRSSGALLDETLVVCSELRFEPFYVGEATYPEGAAFLDERGFELIGLRPEVWKPATRRSAQHRDGRTVWADCIFVRREDALPVGKGHGLLEAKQVVLTAMVGHRAWAEHLLERYLDRIPADWHAELWDVTAPDPPPSRRARARMLAAALAGRARRRTRSSAAVDFSHVVR